MLYFTQKKGHRYGVGEAHIYLLTEKSNDNDDDDDGDHGAAHLARPFNGITVLLQGIREPATQATVH